LPGLARSSGLRGRVELVELARGRPREPGEYRNPATPVERFGLLVREADDHNAFHSRSDRIGFPLAKTFALRKQNAFWVLS